MEKEEGKKRSDLEKEGKKRKNEIEETEHRG
jgi:hypothetical protein